MKRKMIGILACVLLIGTSAVVRADWVPEDGHKMHWAQTPRQGGWDVEFAASRLADDWMCSETGPVTDIHFWISWMYDNWQPIEAFRVGIWSDWPAGPQHPYSTPADLLWERLFTIGEFVQLEQPPDLQGWFDPSSGQFEFENHVLWDQINIVDIPDPFIQEEGIVYWLEVDFGPLPFIGWKETDQNWNDDGVFWYSPDWLELIDPITGGSIDLAFVITGGYEQGSFIRGDCAPINEGVSCGDGAMLMSDAIAILKCLYVPGAPCPTGCWDCADADDNGAVLMSDAIYILKSLYVPGEPPPPTPYPGCGTDPTPDALTGDCTCHWCN